MMSKIYVVTDGCNDDYHICGVFDSADKANRFVDVFGGEKPSDMDVEEFDLNPELPNYVEGMKCWRVDIRKDGSVQRCYLGGDYDAILSDSKTMPRFNYEWSLIVYCLAMDAQHAIKIANERRVAIVATNAWGVE